MFYRAPDVLLTNPLPKASLGAWISCSVATHPRTPPHVEDDAWAWNYPVPMTQSRLVRVLSTPRPGQLRLRQLGRGPRNISINWGNAWREVEGRRQTVLQEKRPSFWVAGVTEANVVHDKSIPALNNLKFEQSASSVRETRQQQVCWTENVATLLSSYFVIMRHLDRYQHLTTRLPKPRLSAFHVAAKMIF